MQNEKFIVGFGEVMLRLCPADRLRISQVLPGNLSATFGGGEANVCASIAMLGDNARYVSALPDNPITAAFVQQMRGLGVDMTRLHLTQEGRMGVYFVEAGANQRPSNVIYDRAYSVISQAAPEDYDFDSMLENAKWLHLSGITPALSENAYLSTLAIAKSASEKGITISCDLNFRKKLWKWSETEAPKELAFRCMSEIVPYVDVIIGNEEDAADVFGIKAGETDVTAGELNVEAYKDVAAALSKKFPKAKYIATTLRESISAYHNNWGGMLYDTASGEISKAPCDENGNYAPYQITDIVDRVGGGDSFAAGLIFALNDEELKAPAQAISFAVAASCLKHSIYGDFNYNSKAEVLNLMKGNASGRVNR